MPYSKGYIPGNRLVECDICGFTWRFSDMRRGISRDQKGYIVCPRDFDQRHDRDDIAPIRKSDGLRKVE